MDTERKRACAHALFNGDFFCIETFSGFGTMRRDPAGKQHLLPRDASDDALGVALLDALNHSRTVNPANFPDFFNFERTKEQYSKWVEALIKHYGYKSRHALFKHMKNCNVELQGNNITIKPMRHKKLEGWGREKDDGINDLEISIGISNQEIGKTLKLAFDRCS